MYIIELTRTDKDRAVSYYHYDTSKGVLVDTSQREKAANFKDKPLAELMARLIEEQYDYYTAKVIPSINV